MIELYLVRHGETEENVAGILQGHLPGRLTAAGVRQAEVLRDALAGVTFDAMVVSDLARTVATAEVLNGRRGLPVDLCPLLRERDWGSLTGRRIAEVRGTAFPPDVESVEALFDRAHRFLAYLLSRYDGQRVLAVGHGLFNRCILALLSGRSIADIPRWGNAEVRRVCVAARPDGSPQSAEIGATAD